MSAHAARDDRDDERDFDPEFEHDEHLDEGLVRDPELDPEPGSGAGDEAGDDDLPPTGRTLGRHARPSAADPHLPRLPRASVAIVVVCGVGQAVALGLLILLLHRVLASLEPFDVGATARAGYHATLRETAGILGLGVVLGLLRAAEFTVAEQAGYEVVRRLRMAMYEHMTRMMPGQLRHRARGGLLLRLTGDLSMLRMWLSRGLLQGSVAVLLLVTALGVVAWLDGWMALALLATTALTAALSVSYGHAMRRATRTMRRRRSLVIGNIDEQINALPVVQTSGRIRGEYTRLSRQNDALNDALCRVAKLRGIMRGIATFGSYAGLAAVLAVGVVQAHTGAADPATVVVAALVTRLISRPMRTLGLANDYWHRGQVSREKVLEFLRSSARPEQPNLERLSLGAGEVVFDDVTVPGVLEGFSATARGGSIVGVTGAAGSGALALAALLGRTVEPSSGRVVVDGLDLATTRWHTSGRSIGLVSPDLPLLRGSVRRNLTYRAADADEAEIQRVAYALGLDEALARHGDDGVRTWLTEGGGNLPVGDRQLLKIARAAMGSPRILVLDRPCAWLEGRRAQTVRDFVARYRGTVVILSDDPADLDLADEVWTLHEGRLAGIETAEERRNREWNERGALAWPAR